jgi:hypothetical protein
LFVLLRFRDCESDSEAVRKIVEAARLFAEAVRVLVEAVRVIIEVERTCRGRESD